MATNRKLPGAHCWRKMAIGSDSAKWILLFAILDRVLWLNSVYAVCEYSFLDNQKLYNYSLASPTSKFPHGVLSEDGFYKVEVNGTVVWFQLCSGMIFNHDQPRCVDCSDCGGPSHCGMECSALASSNVGGYHVCTSIGHVSSTIITIIDEKNPHKGVIVKMYSSAEKVTCSLSVSVICDSSGLQGPSFLEKLGTCDYATELWHPSGCANIVSVYGKGIWGWLGTCMTIIFCIFGGYLLVGIVYRSFFLGVHGIDVIPNLEFWSRIPQRTQKHIVWVKGYRYTLSPFAIHQNPHIHAEKNFFMSLVRRFRGPSEGYRSSYSPVNF